VTRQTSKAQLLKDIQTERRRLEKNLAKLNAGQWIEPGVTGSWSVKDLLAHLTAWEQLFLRWVSIGEGAPSGEIPPVGMSRKAMAVLNEAIFERNRDRSLEDVMADFYASFIQVQAAIQELSEADLFAHGRFAWTGNLTVADYAAGNTCNHYAWANAHIRRWISSSRSQDPHASLKA
jgi:hypothetical protein